MRRFRSNSWGDDPDEIEAIERLHDWAKADQPVDEASLSRSRDALRAAFVASNRPIVRVAPASRSLSPFSRRRFALTGVAAALLLVGSVAGVLAESGPGQPFYSLRLDVEALTLPQPGSPARMEADLARAQARLDEAVRAADSNDWGAEAAAANAYANVISSLSGGPAANAETVRRTLEAQLTVLAQLRSRSREGANGALDSSIARVRAWLGSPGSAEPSGHPGVNPSDGSGGATPGGPNGSSSPGPKTSGDQQGSPNPGGPGPEASPQPQGSPGPNSSAGAGGSSGPHSSAGANPSAGGNGSGPQGPDATPRGTGSPGAG